LAEKIGNLQADKKMLKLIWLYLLNNALLIIVTIKTLNINAFETKKNRPITGRLSFTYLPNVYEKTYSITSFFKIYSEVYNRTTLLNICIHLKRFVRIMILMLT